MKELRVKATEALQKMMFIAIWKKSDRKSIVTGFWLREFENTPLFPNCFLYVLPQKEFPLFRFYAKAWVLVSPGERALWLQCTEESLLQYVLEMGEKTGGRCVASWDAVKMRKAELLVEYKKAFPSTNGMLLNYVYTWQEVLEITSKLNKEYWIADSMKTNF